MDKQEFIEEQALNETRWIMELQNGSIVYQDDGVPGEEISSAWIRMRNSKPSIKNFWIEFRSNSRKPLIENAYAYYFAKAAVGVYGAKEKMTFNSYVIGYKQNENSPFKIFQFEIPSLLLMYEEDREVEMDDERVIKNESW